jgi:hypothetical protein
LCGTILVEKEKGVDKSERIDTIFTQVILTIFFVVMPVLFCLYMCMFGVHVHLPLTNTLVPTLFLTFKIGYDNNKRPLNYHHCKLYKF